MKRNWICSIVLSLLAAISVVAIAPGPFSGALNPQPLTLQAQKLPSSPKLPEPPTDLQEASPSPTASPSPAASPSPTASPSPAASPTPSPAISPSPAVSPSPIASPSPTASPTPSPSVPVLPLAEVPYTDTAMGYQIGILEGYKVTSLAGVTSIESPDGSLAYTVAVRPRVTDNPLTEASLAQVAIETFARGEGFVTGQFEPTAGGVKIPWTGSLTQGENTQLLNGLILSRQVSGKVLVLLVVATEAASDRVDAVFATVTQTLQAID
jgi:hypothetical protein